MLILLTVSLQKSLAQTLGSTLLCFKYHNIPINAIFSLIIVLILIILFEQQRRHAQR